MVFSSVIFLFVFLPTVLFGNLIFQKIGRTASNIFLIIVSLGFYAWGEPKFITVMLASITINYLIGIAIGNPNVRLPLFRKVAIITGVLLNLGILFYFKYLNFTVEILDGFGLNLPLKNIVLPIGISFFTFQGMSYIIDLYRNNVKMQKNPINIALYISLFPQLIAGPIVRYRDVNEQIDNRNVTLNNFANGIRRFVLGLSKKVIIANTLGQVADQIFEVTPLQNGMMTAWLGAICYAFLIYFDFSGYSDMAIGLGKMLGFEFLENFNYPYISSSITEFWRRWHISLSSWFKDYLYIPLGGNRRGNVYLNLTIVFLATGLWHGAAWNFVLWGLLHGFFIVLEKLVSKKFPGITVPKPIGWAFTMIIVLVGWVLFRAPNLEFAGDYLGIFFGIIKPEQQWFSQSFYLNTRSSATLVLALIASTPILPFVNKLIKSETIKLILANISTVVLLFICIILVVTSTYNPFIYFRF